MPNCSSLHQGILQALIMHTGLVRLILTDTLHIVFASMQWIGI